MPDPLLNEDFGDVESQSASATEPAINLGRQPAYQAPLEDPILKGETDLSSDFGGVSPDNRNSRLNRTAEQVGGAIGTVVSQARRLPDSARRGLHLVRDRAQDLKSQTAEQISGPASSLASNAQERVRELGDVARQAGERAQQRAGEWMDLAEERGRVLLDKADELTSYVADRTGELKQRLDVRTRELRETTRLRAQEVSMRGQRIVRERPLESLGCIAGAAFLLGVTLRIMRSRNARGY